jgi:hypothetical protein
VTADQIALLLTEGLATVVAPGRTGDNSRCLAG